MSTTSQRRLLWTVLAINGGLFIAELVVGLIASSMGLMADSLDMLADALVYGLSLAAVGGTVQRKGRIVRMSGYLQLTLATLGLAEVVRRVLDPVEAPSPAMMVIVSLFACVGNVICLLMLRRERHGEAHLQASWIFTSNDVLANIGVMIAALFVFLLDSRWPDLVIGAVVFGLVLRGALRIFNLNRPSSGEHHH